jgi:hypothetical protein
MIEIPDEIPLPDNVIKLHDGTEYQKQKDGSLKKIKDKGEVKALNWQQRAIKAERAFLALLEERKKLQDLILESCIKLGSYGFECKAGPLETCEEFIQIKAFARGTPHVTRPPLDSMPLDGMRLIKAIHVPQEDRMQTEYFLNCGHSIKTSVVDSSWTINGEVKCAKCLELLKERGMYQE